MAKGDMIATRDGFGDEIVELGRENKDIYVVDADISKSCKTGKFAKALPEQHVNVGIAEQNAAGVAAGCVPWPAPGTTWPLGTGMSACFWGSIR